MSGRAAAVLVLSSTIITSAVFGQCNYRPVASFQFRASYFDVAADQLDLLAANGYGVSLYALSGGAPVHTMTLALPGPTRVVRSFNGNAFVGSGTGIYFIAKTFVSPTGPATAITVAGSIDAGAVVNDLMIAGTRLYAATANGLQQYDISDPTRPVRTPVSFPTSGTTIASLALDRNTLYVADSDNSVEVFSIADPSNPQKTATLPSLPRVTSVIVDRTHLFVSDGVQTDAFLISGTTASKVATLPFGVSAFATISGEIAAVAGADRRLHIYDFTLAAAPVELFATDLLPSGGTINRVGNLAVADGKLFVAAGDIGLAAFDLSAFRAPFPLRSYTTGGTTTAVSAADRIYVSRAGGGLSEYKQASTGELTRLRDWDDHVDRVHDADNGFLLTSSGSSLTYWTLTSTQPVVISTASFAAPVQSAIIEGPTAYAILENQTLWSADLAQTAPAPQAVTTGAQHPTWIARSGSSIAIADVRDDGTTVILNYPTGDLKQTARTATVAGLATTLAHSGNLAAVFTFRGITVADLATGAITTMNSSNSAVPTNLAIDGTNLLAAVGNSLIVWDARTGALLRTIPLPSTPAWIDVPQSSNGFAAIATADGIADAAYATKSDLPAMLPLATGNAYYRKVLASGNRLYLFDGRAVDVFETSAGFTPHYLTKISPSGVLDVAASERGLFALTSTGTAIAYRSDGTVVAQRNVVDTNADKAPISITTVAGAPWVSMSQGCRTGDCQSNTLVLDPQSLVVTSSMAGAVTDVAVAGITAYAITAAPSEVRVINVADPAHPSVSLSRATDGTAAPVSIAFYSPTVYVLGERLYAYTASSLASGGDMAVAFDPSTYADQSVVISGTCGIVTGRTAMPELFSVSEGWKPSAGIPAPAAVRSVATSGNNVYLLTDDSLEIWSTGTAKPAPRRRAVR
jgi:hypothetical protein